MYEINIKVMTDVAFETLKKNYVALYYEVLKNKLDGHWIGDFAKEEPYETKKYTIKDFELLPPDGTQEREFENAKIIYEHLRELPRYILCDSKFWAWVIFEKAYVQYHGQISGSPRILRDRCFYTPNRYSLMYGAVARSFFLIDMSYDETKDDPYELSRYLLSKPHILRSIANRNVTMIDNFCLAYLETLYSWEKKGNAPLFSGCIEALMQDMSRMGSVMLLDVMTREELKTLAQEKLKKIVFESQTNAKRVTLNDLLEGV